MTLAEEAAVVDDRDDLPIFIHRELDDLGLDPYEFRVYARLARRADGKAGAYESVANIAAACRMGTTRVRQCLRQLELRGLITRVDRAGETTVYRLTPKRVWANQTPTSDVAPPRDDALTPTPGVAPSPDVGGPQRHALGTPTPGVAKGTPLKVHQLKEEKKRDTRARTSKANRKEPRHEFNPAEVAQTLPDNFDRELFQDFCAHRLKLGAPMSLLALKQFVTKHKRHPPAVLDEMFRAAIIAGWKDLYPPRDSPPQQPKRRSTTSNTSADDPLAQYREAGL